MTAHTERIAPGQSGETQPPKPDRAMFENEAGQADGSQPELHPETRRFLETYFNGQSVFVCAIPPDGAPKGGTFGIPGGLDQLAVSIGNHAGAGFYYCPNATKARILKKPSKDDMGAARGVWSDLDPLTIAEAEADGWQHERERLLDLADWLMGLDHPPTFIVDSGNGIQPVWLTEPHYKLPDGLEVFERLGGRVEKALGGTESTANVDRVLRLPGTTNFPNAKKKVKGRTARPASILYETDVRYSAEDLTELADFLETNPPPDEMLGTRFRANGTAGEPRSGPGLDKGVVSKVIKELEDAAVLSTPMADDLRGKSETHLSLHPEMKDRWDGSTNGLSDTSRSGRDCSMVYFLVNDDFTNVEIAHLLLEYPHGAAHDTEKFGRPWMQLRYIARMLIRARTPTDDPSAGSKFSSTETISDPFAGFVTPPMPDGILPPIIQDFANVEARNKGVAPYAPGMAALVVAAAAIPDGLRLKAKVHEDWHEEARIWLALIGPVSAKKSPVLRAAMVPLKAAEEKAAEDYEADMAVYSLAKQKAEKNETECDLSEPDPPPQYILNDTTIEAAGDVLATNPQGVLLEHDELSGFFGSMDKYNSGRGSSADRAFWLRAWNGGPHKVNRRSLKKPLRIPNLSVSVIGGIQPDTIRRVIKDCTDDGLIQRLIPVVIGPAKVGEDIPADKQTTAYKRLIRRLVRLPEGTVRLSPGAQSIRRDLEVYLHGYSVVEDLSPRLAAFMGKLEGYFARLALTLHVCEAVDLSMSKTLLPSEVSADTAKRAGRLIREFIIPHAKHFYLDIASEGTELPQARAIAGYILAKGCKRFTFGDLTTNVHCCRKKTKDEVRRMIEPLEMFGWVEPEQVFDPRSWTVNPEVHIKFARRAEEERARRESIHEKIREEAGHGQ